MLFVAIKFHCKSFVLPAAWNRQVIPHLLCQNKVMNSLFGFMLSKSSLTKQIVGKFGQVIASTKWTLKCAWSCTGIASVDRVLDLFKVSGAILSCQTWDLASMTFTCITSYVCWLCAVSHWKLCDEHNIGCMGPNWAEEYLVLSPDHTFCYARVGLVTLVIFLGILRGQWLNFLMLTATTCTWTFAGVNHETDD